jgi:hypothetical protein
MTRAHGRTQRFERVAMPSDYHHGVTMAAYRGLVEFERSALVVASCSPKRPREPSDEATCNEQE